MDKEFCLHCGEKNPQCAIVELPQKSTLTNICEGKVVNTQEYLVCGRNAMNIDSGLSITEDCNECKLCQVTCPQLETDVKDLNIDAIEKIVFNSFDKLGILIKGLFPTALVACEVQVEGNFRTKRIDVVVKQNKAIVLIKVLSNIDKVPLYSRSYEEVQNRYVELVDTKIISTCLVPTKKIDQALLFGFEVTTIQKLIEMLEVNK